MVKPGKLHIKLLRELWHMRGQVLAIALVVMGGIAVCVMSLSTYDSVKQTRDIYYAQYRFANIFVDLTRAPLRLVERVREISGVSVAEPRVNAAVTLLVDGFNEPITASVVSIPPSGQPLLNALHLRSGRLPESSSSDEILLSAAFAQAHRLREGSKIDAVINGRLQTLTVVGLALSPEHVYQIAPGSLLPDYKRYGVLWMPYPAISVAYDMDGAFNSVVLTSNRGANERAIIDQLDKLLAPYGGRGAYTRERQVSNEFLSQEFDQLRTMALLFPLIFISVSVFLLNVVIGRLIENQREVIAILKAFGYSNRTIGLHYLSFTMLITLLGTLLGLLLGSGLGNLMTAVFGEYYHFPALTYANNRLQVALAIALCFAASAAGTLRPVLAAAALPPAEAMRPKAPPRFRKALPERIPWLARLSQTSKMILRNLDRQRIKSLMAIAGISAAVAVMMVGNFQQAAIDKMMHVQFKLTQKEDLSIGFSEAVAYNAIYSLDNLPGVSYVEGMRSAAVKLRFEHRQERSVIIAFSSNSQLRQLRDESLAIMPIPTNGILITDYLAEKLGASVGDKLEIEFLGESRQIRHARIDALSTEYLGSGVYMSLRSLNRMLDSGPAINTALLTLEANAQQDTYRRLRAFPAVRSINIRQTLIDAFSETLERVVIYFTAINAALGAIIAFGVVYNTMRIAMAERARELASLRVLGYTRAEVAYTLLGELALLTLLSLVPGFLLGVLLCDILASGLQNDLYRLPLVLTAYTYGFSAFIVILSAVASGLIILRQVYRLDLVAVLKTRE
ncbi:MAG: ABC transporter permease [Pseudomonadales bacterium]|nr:ABC transporter permease [Pseudomonadales bacterium]